MRGVSILRSIAFVLGLVLWAVASADDLIVSRGVLADPGGKLTAGEAARREFAPTGNVIALGYTGDVHWIRLRVRAPSKGTEVVLRIAQPYLDEVRLYVPDAVDPVNWRTRVTGDRYPYLSRDRPSAALGFVVTVAESEATFYLRLQTTSTSLMALEAVEPEVAARMDRQVDYLVVLFVGFMLAMTLSGIQDTIASREPISALFTLYQALYVVYGLVALGYLAPLATEQHPRVADWATNLVVCAIPFAFALFSRSLLVPYAPPRALVVGINVLLGMFPLQLVIMAAGYVQPVLALNLMLMLFARWYLFAVSVALTREQVPSRNFVRIVYLATALLVTVLLIPMLGTDTLVESHLREAGGLLINGLISSSLFFLVLHARSRQARATAERNALDLLVTRKELEMEHALKEKAEAAARTDFLTGLASRRHFVEMAERELARAARYRKPMALLMMDLDYFKEVNDTRGHSVGDFVLQSVAARIRDAVREVDLVGRVGGEEFAAVLVESEGATALEVAQRVRRAVGESEFTPPEGPPIRVTLSIGMTELRGRQANIDILFAEADRALYSAKEAGRDTVHCNVETPGGH